MIVRMEHARSLGWCAKGGRAFAARHNLDWSEFLRNGLDAEVLLATGDGRMVELVEHAKRMEAGRGK